MTSVDIVHLASSKTTRHHGIILWPPPSSNLDDPLRWPRWFKILALLSVALFNFTANFAGSGLSVATPILQMQYHKTQNQSFAVLTWNFFLLGLGNLIWVPLSTKYGKRIIMLVSNCMLFTTIIWTAKAQSWNSLVASRCLSGFAAAAGESIVPGIVSDIFFLHERAAMMSIYVILAAGATAVGPLVAAFVVAGTPGTWRDFTWICVGLAGFNAICIFLFYPESTFHRPDFRHATQPSPVHDVDKSPDAELVETSPAQSATATGDATLTRTDTVVVVQQRWSTIWTTTWRHNQQMSLWTAFMRPLAFLVYPAVLWTVFLYGLHLAAQVILIFVFPSLLLAPPYLFKTQYIGLIEVAALIGFLVACYGGGYISDTITMRSIRKHEGEYQLEQRLLSLIPGFWIAPVGCIVVAFTCAYKLHWIGISFGFAMVSFGTVYAPNIAITYVADCYSEYAADCLVVVNAFKNLVAFIFLYVASDWVEQSGWIQVYMVMFMLLTLILLVAIPLYFFGAKLRAASEAIYKPKVSESTQ
ncbi:hypothetical protein LTR84_012331 [Exophiala bonariae]|uniref:Major facilitator superfamily (MFS) profile domain-containing protein n=1 Tax=Exophiala bonariae TaxID=1690606 RepID=A0AAV9NFX3_9EURO|nr:hypothetical protein LTR84_012331 [Exophiala bonariae]